MKKCNRCNRIYNDNISYCETCGEKLIDNNSINQTNEPNNIINNQNNKNSNKGCIITIVIVLILVIILFGLGFYIFYNITQMAIQEGSEDISENYENIIESGNSNTTNNVVKYSLDSTFTFDNLEITIGSKYDFSIIDNRLSDYNGQPAVKVPITVKNLSNETHHLNSFYLKYYGSKGSELDKVNYYFDDSVESAGDLRTDATYTKYCYLLYDGDGTYTIELDNWENKINIDIVVNK